jgi:hypothetical protein
VQVTDIITLKVKVLALKHALLPNQYIVNIAFPIMYTFFEHPGNNVNNIN